MRVKCIALLPNDGQAKLLGVGKHYFPGSMVFGVNLGKEYIVIAISFLSGAPWIFILNESETYIHPVPLCLFEIVDGVVSRFWVAKTNADGYFNLWPPSFYQPYYHDDLTEGVAEVVEDFNRVKQLILDEDALHGTNQSRTATNKPQ